MKTSYGFFNGKTKLTEEDIVDFEAHAAIMQDRDLREDMDISEGDEI